MPYKISGSKNATARVIVIKESDWSIESDTVVSGSGTYDVVGLDSGLKTVVAETTAGEALGYGLVPVIEYGDKGIFGGGTTNGTSGINTIDSITISTTGNASAFGTLSESRNYLGTTSNGLIGRAVFGGGYTTYPTYTDTMDYVSIDAGGTADDFGNLLLIQTEISACSNGTNDRGIFGGGTRATAYNVMEYITIGSAGNSQSFGELIESKTTVTACSNDTNDRGIWAGGWSVTNTITYITISTPGNAQEFGDLTQARGRLSSTSNATGNKGVFGGGTMGSSVATIDWITINSLSSAQEFGDLTSARHVLSATSNGIGNRGVFAGGGGWSDTIDYVTITSTSNAHDFGNLTAGRDSLSATSNA